MSEFKLQHLVSELLTALGGKNTPESLIETLQKDSGFSTLQQSQSQIHGLAESLGNSDLFTNKLADLKQKNVDNLNSYVQLLSQISRDSGVKALLHKTKKQGKVDLKVADRVTRDNLPQLRNRLKKAALRKSENESYSSISINNSIGTAISTPSIASWVQRRPAMSWDFSTQSFSNNTLPVPMISQESILIEDLLNLLIGLPGCYIEVDDLVDNYGPRTFKINDNVSVPLQELVKQILPIASHYSVIQRFTEEKSRFEFGQVNNALAEAMSTILKQHLIYVTQLEDEFRADNLNLQKLWFYVQKKIHALAVTANIASKISKSDARGGKVLSLLHEFTIASIGDERTQQRCLYLMEAACVPYMKILTMWIYRGIICDPINEFLVKDNEVIQKEDMPLDYSADYWDKKYSTEREKVPKFLEPVSDIILKAGKYLNVIRQCGEHINNKVSPIVYQTDEKHYIESIENAYQFASQRLLNLIINEKDLLGRLRSVKHYFLLDQGDFIVTFLSLCEKELNKNLADMIQGRLDSLLDLAMRLSALRDPHKEDLKIELLPYNLQFQMMRILSIQTDLEQDFWSSENNENLSVIDSFAFNYTVHWPLSLILNRKALACYQMIFRHLFYCKYIERLICQVWKFNKVAKKFSVKDTKQYRMVFVLRQRMLHYVQNLEYHMMVEVIEPHWCQFIEKISKVNNVDEILSSHYDFLNNCLRDCILTLPHILRTVMKLLTICVDFCKFIQGEEDNIASDYTLLESAQERISIFDLEFTTYLRSLLEQINELNKNSSEHDRLFNLLYRLDFNSFYSTNLLGKKISFKSNSSG